MLPSGACLSVDEDNCLTVDSASGAYLMTSYGAEEVLTEPTPPSTVDNPIEPSRSLQEQTADAEAHAEEATQPPSPDEVVSAGRRRTRGKQ